MHQTLFSKNKPDYRATAEGQFHNIFHRIEQISGNIAKNDFVWQKTEHQLWKQMKVMMKELNWYPEEHLFK